VFNNFEGGTADIGKFDAESAGFFLARLHVVIGGILEPMYGVITNGQVKGKNAHAEGSAAGVRACFTSR
jgi:hypothetical protein